MYIVRNFIRRIAIFKYIILFSSFLFSQDIAGSYQFYGLYIVHQSLARYNTPVSVSDIHGLEVKKQFMDLDNYVHNLNIQTPYYKNQNNVVKNVISNNRLFDNSVE